MTLTMLTGTGETIRLGRQLGSGGEGVVHEVDGKVGLVAKLYHPSHAPDAQKQEKLRYMASLGDPELLGYTAWPTAVLHRVLRGPVVGFLMQSIGDRKPIHMFYSPAHRRQDHPDLGWDFLLFAARNTAAAFEAIHRGGHVVGDVNQGNVVIGANSTAMLIDADSFQIRSGGSVHLCKVGVSHFTPPELQNLPSFDRVARTTNHDAFGLALLIFHLLFGGRHPYSGVPVRSDAGEALEKDIQSLRYAYAADSQRRGLRPPPRSISVELVPPNVRQLFLNAFTEPGVAGQRPRAAQWREALDAVRAQLRSCSTSRTHVFPTHLSACPWCALEAQGVIYFLDFRVPGHSAGFALAQVWSRVEAIAPPGEMALPSATFRVVVPTPLPPAANHAAAILILRIFVSLATIGLLFVVPSGGRVLAIAAGALLFILVGLLGSRERESERLKRRAALQAARTHYDSLVQRARSHAGSDAFMSKKEHLGRLRDEYQQLNGRQQAELSKLSATAESRQRDQFLDRCFIDSATISGVGPAKKAALRSFGIETALDVTWARVIAVKGFGEVKTQAMIDWRKACERRFVFNPLQMVTDADKQAVMSRFAVRRRTIESELLQAPAELSRLRQNAISNAATLRPELESAALRLAQAEADLNVV